MNTRFTDRADAGRALARRLLQLHLPEPIVVLALPRGGVPVAAEVARALKAPMDLLLVRKIGTPCQAELALAAVVDGDPPQIVINQPVWRNAALDAGYIEAQTQAALREISRQRAAYLGARARIEVAGCTAIVVDDGIATGTTLRAALKALRLRSPARLVLAVPVAPRDTLESLRAEVDQLVCLVQPEPFFAVGEHYVDFDQVDDREVVAALDAAYRSSPPAARSPKPD